MQRYSSILVAWAWTLVHPRTFCCARRRNLFNVGPGFSSIQLLQFFAVELVLDRKQLKSKGEVASNYKNTVHDKTLIAKVMYKVLTPTDRGRA